MPSGYLPAAKCHWAKKRLAESPPLGRHLCLVHCRARINMWSPTALQLRGSKMGSLLLNKRSTRLRAPWAQTVPRSQQKARFSAALDMPRLATK